MRSPLKWRRRSPILLAATVIGIAVFSEQAFSEWSLGKPIVMYWSQPPLTATIAQRAVEAGFNMVYVSELSPIAPQMTIAEQYGLRTLCYYPSLLTPNSLDGGTRQAQLNAMIDQYKASPAAYAYFLKDEPDATQFAGLAKLKNHVSARDSRHLSFMNLWNCNATSAEYGVPTYTDYYNRYVDTVQPDLLSTDYYQFYKYPNGDPYDAPGYLKNLGVVSQVAHNAGKPFMNVVQACAWSGLEQQRVPTTNQLRYLQNSSLAYGAQGICYFNYYTPLPNTGGIQPYPDGSPSPVFTSLVSLKGQFERVASNFAGLHWIGTYIKGYQSTSKGPLGTTQLPSTSPFKITNVSNILSYSDGAMIKGVDVGLFSLDGSGGHALGDATFAMVTANDYSDGLKTVTINGPGDLSYFDAIDNAWVTVGSNQFTLNLQPGGGVLVGLTSLVPVLQVPEPTSLALLTAGLVGLLAYAWRKRRSW
jgi:hypothetical protein